MFYRVLNVNFGSVDPVNVGYQLRDKDGADVGALVQEPDILKWDTGRWRSSPALVELPDNVIGVEWRGESEITPGVAEIWKLTFTNTAPDSGEYLAVEQPT